MESPLFQSDKIKRSLVLAGGGVRLAYHAGVLKALEEAKIGFNHVDGTSGGIFNTGMLASGQNPDEIAKRWRALNVFSFMSPTPISNYLKLTRMNAMGDADGIRTKVFPTLGIDISKINKNSRFEATFNVCNFSTKEIESINHIHITENHLIAGMSLPIFMPSIKIGNDWYTDAVWVKDANLLEAVKQGAEEIFLVFCIGNSREYLEGSFLQYVHMIEMSAAGGLLMEFDWLVEINKQILIGKSPYGQQVPIKLQVIKPSFPLPLDPDLFFGHINLRGLINMGYADAKKTLNSLPEKGVNLNFKASQMNEPGVSLQFMVEYSGKIKINNTLEKTKLYLLFDFRKLIDSQIVANFYGSISFGKEEQEISFFEAIVKKNSNGNIKSILIEAKYLLDNKTHHFLGEISLTNAIDFRIGLEFKNMLVQVDNNEKCVFTQNIKSRMRSIFKSKIYQNASFFKKLSSKKEIINWIYS